MFSSSRGPSLPLGGVLHESSVHECLKSSLAFRKPATAVASRRPGRADGLMVGLDGHASLSAGRAPWRDGQAFLPLRRRPEGTGVVFFLGPPRFYLVEARVQYEPV